MIKLSSSQKYKTSLRLKKPMNINRIDSYSMLTEKRRKIDLNGCRKRI